MDKIQSSVNQVEFYNLEKVRFIIKDGTGLDIAYAYEDLVFAEHGIFILQFLKGTASSVYCWFNNECEEKERISIFNSLKVSATLNKMKIEYKGKFEMNQKEGVEQIGIRFIEQ